MISRREDRFNRRKFLRTGAATGGALGGLLAIPRSVRAETRRKKPNIVYVFADQWRGAATGYAGDPNVKTPHLDKLAAESVNFRNAVSVCPVCTPYRASLMTGRYPTSTGIFLNDLYLPSEELCMADIYKTAGYNTAYIGKWHLDGHGRGAFTPPSRRQGWEYWKAIECNHKNYHSPYYAGDSEQRRSWGAGYDAFAQTRDAQQYIRDHADDSQPFILMLSYGPPHPSSSQAPKEHMDIYVESAIEPPPNVPAQERDNARRLLHRYYAHCSALDQCVGDVMQTIAQTGIAENTIVVFTSDHGGMLLSHGKPQEWKQVPWSESAHVPFLLRYPAAHDRGGRVIQTPMNTPDILPTLLGLSNLAIPDVIEGDDLSALILKNETDHDRAALYMSVAPFVGQGAAHRSIRTRQYTYVCSEEGPWLLFDDQADPYQLKNLLPDADYQTVRIRLDKMLRAELKKIGDDFRSPASYISQWRYVIGPDRAIPYHREAVPQGPHLRGD